jgi:hypothetical protein
MIFAFSFIYRLVLMLLDGFPPGADIGLHNSVIHSIIGSGNVNFFYNFYHMGGSVSLTFPGYHIFAAGVVLISGLPEYLAHAIVVSLFSSVIILVGYLITKRVWSLSAAVVVAVLLAVSRFDIEMLMWGGYPNVITLALIPLTFYLYLVKERFSPVPVLVSSSILAGSIFLTHSLSAAMYVSISVIVILFVLVKPKVFGTNRRTCFFWFLPIVLGLLIISPFIFQAVPEYFANNSSISTDPASSTAIKLATIATQQLPLDLVLPLFGVLAGFLVFSKKYAGRFLALPTFLLSVWTCVPLVLSQTYLIGFPIDYNRFLYFLILPLIIFIGVLIEHGSAFFAHIFVRYRSLGTNTLEDAKKSARKWGKLSIELNRKNLFVGFIVFFILFAFVVIPIFMSPLYYNGGQTIQSFYQVVDNKLWDAIQWIKANTSVSDVLVSDALYGWWLGGFAQRPTYSAVDPQYLTVNSEFNKTLFARNLLDTDFQIDNGFLQVREDGGYMSRHNPEFLTRVRNEYFRYGFFNFDNNATFVTLRNGEDVELVYLSTVPVLDMYMEETANSETIVVTKGNNLFNFTQTVTVYSQYPGAADDPDNSTQEVMASSFAKVTEKLHTDNQNVTFDSVQFDLQTKGTQNPEISPDYSYVGLIDMGMKTIGEIIYTNSTDQPEEIRTPTDPNLHTPIVLVYTLDSKSEAEFSCYMGVYQYTDKQLGEVESGKTSFADLIKSNTQLISAKLLEVPPPRDENYYVFDYRQALQEWNVSYVVCRVSSMYPKYLDDPMFSLVFINEEVAIFKVDGNITRVG